MPTTTVSATLKWVLVALGFGARGQTVVRRKRKEN